MSDEVSTLRETTSSTLSDRQVGIGNIYERELPDKHGVVATRMSAAMAVHDPATNVSLSELVTVGDVVGIGADKYCVVAIDEGNDQLGSITLRKVSPEP